ncbi:MAG: SDR family NAD(P)-dependent oxidoreductase [Sandaracinus sp.]|nr:SDR family NAD(P)-dependent oxidoreductase [Sandaracinus sp.]
MSGELRFDGRVVVVTGAGNGLGKSHALAFAARGAKVVVNDLGGDIHGGGGGSRTADVVVDEIRAAGGEAVANYDSVTDGDKIIQTAIDAFGKVDVVINNAGILRDVSFHKMTRDDWEKIYAVHVQGAYAVTAAAWERMREQGYGRVILTASAAGIYGNFGQANYAMAKLGLVGFSNTLAIEGRKKGVHVNAIAPIAGSRMTETVLPPELLAALKPEYVTPLVLWLCHESCEETGGLFEVGGGFMGKLRWERAAGKSWRLGREITPEDVKTQWKAVAGFDKTTHPENIAQSMAPIMDNVERGPSKGGNQFIDVDEALGYRFESAKSSYDERDLALYALGVGAAKEPSGEELKLVYEMSRDGFVALPTYGVIPAINWMLDMGKRGVTAPGIKYGIDRVLHGEQMTKLERPLPPKAKLRHEARIKDIFDKGKGALVVTEVKSYDEDDELLITNEITTFVRGAGGWGGDRGPSAELNVAPERAPDFAVEEATLPNQALLYRLSGDWNPLHADPSFAKAMSFDRPILHGLCTFGFAARHVIAKCAKDGDPRYFKSIQVRFAKSVYPGDTLITEIWKESDTRIVFRVKVKERDEVVISNAAIELYESIPKKKDKPKASAAAAPTAKKSGPTSSDVFRGIGLWMAEKPGEAKVGKIFQFKLSDPESVWTLDCASDAPSVSEGETTKPDCMLELTDANFVAMTKGEKDPQKMYFGGELKIGGDIMASQKLGFLKKVEPRHVEAAMGASGGVEATPAKKSGPTSSDVFRGIGLWMAEKPGEAKVGKIFQFKLSDPESVWTLDCASDAPSVAEGETTKPDCVLELTDANFVAMTKGEKDPQKMYFGGELKIGGDIMASQKLGFLKKVEPRHVEAAMGAATKQDAPKAAPKVAPKQARAPQLFEALSVKAPKGQGKIQIRVTDPDGAWLVDLEAGAVKSGTYEGATTVLTLADADLAALATGEASASELYQKGRLRVDGQVDAARDLAWLKA